MSEHLQGFEEYASEVKQEYMRAWAAMLSGDRDQLLADIFDGAGGDGWPPKERCLRMQAAFEAKNRIKALQLPADFEPGDYSYNLMLADVRRNSDLQCRKSRESMDSVWVTSFQSSLQPGVRIR